MPVRLLHRAALPWVIVGALAIALGAILAYLVPAPRLTLQTGTWLPRSTPIAAFHLRDFHGRDFTLANLRGHQTLLYFGFTNCPDVCPTTLAQLVQVQRGMPLPGSRVVFVSIDPQRDSAAVLRAYLGAFSPAFIGVRDPTQALAPLMSSLHAFAERENLPGGAYTMLHSSALYLLDDRGRLAAVFTPPLDTAGLTADLRHIAASGRLGT